MKQTGILMRPDMVSATIRGDKTETRRIIKPQPEIRLFKGNQTGRQVEGWQIPGTPFFWEPDDSPDCSFLKCPYGKVGDILYVKETFRTYCNVNEDGISEYDNIIIDYAADGNHESIPMIDADGFHMYNKNGTEKYIPWTPSIHMPKKYARIWLEITDIQAERVQDITEEGAKAEGVLPVAGVLGDGYKYYHDLKLSNGVRPYVAKAYDSFASLWMLINGADSWKANDWVFVIKFKVLSTTGKPDNI